MPRIRTYTNKETIRPDDRVMAANDRAAGASVSLGRAQQESGYYSGQAMSSGIRALAGGVQEVEQHIAQNETGKLAADFATAQAELTTQWNEVAKKADPNDHEAANRFMTEVVRPRLDQMGDGLLTQQGQSLYQKAVAGLHADLFAKTTADQASLAGQAAIVNLDTVKNQLSQTVRNDPSGFKGALAMANITTEGLVSTYNLPRDKALVLGQQVREEIAKSAFIGMADKNPTAARAALAAGEFNDYFDGTTAKTMDSYAEAQMKAETEAQKAAVIETRRQQKEAYQSSSAALSASLVDPQTGDLRVPPDYFKNLIQTAQMPEADSGEIRAAINMGQSIIKEQQVGMKAVTDPQTYVSFRDRMFLGSADKNVLTLRDVYQARSQGQLSDKDFTFFRGAVEAANKGETASPQEKDFNASLKSLKHYISNSNGLVPDAVGDDRFYQFQSDAAEMAQRMKTQGKSWDEIKAAARAMVPQYQVPTKDGIRMTSQQITQGLRPGPTVHHTAAPARNPGESAAAYLKRTGGQ
jgi:hypothetical protein